MREFLPGFLIEYSDSSFTNPHEVVLPDEPLECTGNFTHMGAKYWGFETDRHLALTPVAGGFRYDSSACHHFVIGLDQRSVVEEIRVSTKWFTGNQVPFVSIELIDGDQRQLVVEQAKLTPDEEHVFTVASVTATRCRVMCFHEGGIARVNLFGTPGEAVYQQPNLLEQATISYVSNDHYGSPAMAVAGCRREDHMIGWESARSGFGEQCVFSFDHPIIPQTLVVDTYLHRLNPPLSSHLYGYAGDDLDAAMVNQPRWVVRFACGTEVQPDDIQAYMSKRRYLEEPVKDATVFEVRLENPSESPWIPLVPQLDLKPDTWHEAATAKSNTGVQHLLYMHFPNGGVHGLKVFGEI